MLLNINVFAQELLPRMDSSTEKYGYVDNQGQFVIAPQFEYATRFADGYAVIREQGLFGYIDSIGNTIIEPRYYKVGGYSEGLFRVQQAAGEFWFFLNEKGQRAFKKSFYYVGNFHEGLAVFAEKDRRGETHFGYLGKNGKVVVKPVYAYAADIKDGFGKIALDLTSEAPRYGYVDAKGEVVVPCVYNDWMVENQLIEYKNRPKGE